MFWLKNTLKNIAEKPYIYFLILLTFAASVTGSTYFLTICKGVIESNSEEAAVLYGGAAALVIVLCCIDISFQFAHLMQCCAHKYSIYRACGADNRAIAGLAFADGIVIALIGYAVGFCVSLWIVPMFTSSLGGVKLALKGHLFVFALNMVFVVLTYLITLWKASRKTVFERGVEEYA